MLTLAAESHTRWICLLIPSCCVRGAISARVRIRARDLSLGLHCIHVRLLRPSDLRLLIIVFSQSFCFSLSPSLFVCLSLSFSRSFCLSVSVSLYISLGLSVYLSIYLSIDHLVWLSMNLSIYLPISLYPSMHVIVYINLSVHVGIYVQGDTATDEQGPTSAQQPTTQPATRDGRGEAPLYDPLETA